MVSLREALLVFVNNPSAYLKEKCKIAEGLAPVQGIDGYIHVLIGGEDDSGGGRWKRKMEESITKS